MSKDTKQSTPSEPGSSTSDGQPPSKRAKIDDNKVFNDPIHGSIRLDPLLVKIIDTPQFQRLRYVKQLGGCLFVYPGATHSRFEHSIGVAYLARKLTERLQQEHKDDKDVNITDRDVMCVTIAGLCHDLGHGPFSHVWDVKVISKTVPKDQQWKHEKASQVMLDYLIEENGLKEEFIKVWKEFLNSEQKQKCQAFLSAEVDKCLESEQDEVTVNVHKQNITDENVRKEVDTDLEFIKQLIDRESEPKDPDPLVYPEKNYLYEIVANKRNGIDVDKWDYFKRDCHYLGLTCVFDILRPMEFVRVIKVDGEQQICYRDKEARNIFQMFQTRELLHRQAYKHKTTRIIEQRLADAFVLADKSGIFKIPIGKLETKDGKDQVVKKRMTETKDKGPDPEMYTHLTDHVFEMILATAPPTGEDNEERRIYPSKLREAKQILEDIHKRHLYKYLGEICYVKTSEVISDSEDTLISVSESKASSDSEKIKIEDILVDNFIEHAKGAVDKDSIHADKVKFDFGNADNNPFDTIRFFSKHNINEGKEISLSSVSSFLPQDRFQEFVVRFYFKNPTDLEKREDAIRCFDKWYEKKEKEKEKKKQDQNLCSDCRKPLINQPGPDDTPIKPAPTDQSGQFPQANGGCPKKLSFS